MRIRSIRGCAALLAAGGLLSACEPAFAPDARSAPEPAGFDALLQALQRDAAVDPALVAAMEGLVAAIEQSEGTYAGTPAPPTVTPAMERALRELPAARGDVEATLRILREAAEESRAQP